MYHAKSPEQLCLVPRLDGLGGMASFQARLVSGLEKRGYGVTYDLGDPRSAAILVIGGTRQLGALWRARRRGTRIVQRLDGMNWLHRKQRTAPRLYLRSEANNAILALIRRRLASTIVYQSHFSRDWWERVRGDLSVPGWVIYNGVDLDAYTPDGPQERPAGRFRILLVEGRLHADNAQGLESALSLVELLQRVHHLPIELAIAGELSPELQAGLANRADGKVTWLGVLKRNQLPTVYRSAHLLFSADLAAACPNVVIEALACGLPVVAFDTGALRELVPEDAGRVVPYGGDFWKLEPPSLPPMAKAVATVLAGNDGFRAAARLWAAHSFGLDPMVEAYLQVLLG